jgi:hypothetical protein
MVVIVIFIPALLAIYFLTRYSVRESLLRVYVPCIVFLPLYIKFFIKGATVTPGAPIGLVLFVAAIFYGRRRRWQLTWVDFAVLLYCFSSFIADAHYRKLTLGLYAGWDAFFLSVCPYIIGRFLIEENGLRVRFAKSLVLCLAIVGVVGLWEFRMTANPFQSFADYLNKDAYGILSRQMRWGFARVAGPYASAITAGMVFTAGLILQLWLYGAKLWRSAKSKGRQGWGTAILLALIGGLLMSQSRGPWIGCALGLIPTFVGFAKNRRRAAIVSIVILAISLSITYVVLDDYTNVDYHAAADSDQQNASYRRELWTTYKPVVVVGGIWGWGRPFSTDMAGVKSDQPSIDNMYLLLAVGQGYFGVAVFVFIILATIGHLLRLCASVRRREDAMFVFALLGIVLATSFTLTTVFLGEPMNELFFLICGWAWSLKKQSFLAGESELSQVVSAPAFERVFV